MTEPFRNQDLFGGHGEVLVWSLLRPPLAPFQEVLDCQLAPHGRVGAHLQEHFPEIVLVRSGRGVARVNGLEQSLTPGTLVTLPLGSVLEIENTDAEPLRYFIVKAR